MAGKRMHYGIGSYESALKLNRELLLRLREKDEMNFSINRYIETAALDNLLPPEPRRTNAVGIPLIRAALGEGKE
jgi:hypothetical protein